MKKLYINSGGSVIFDPETGKMSDIYSHYTNIRTMYYIKEEGDLVAQSGEQKFEAHVIPGDILIQFYNDEKPNRFIIVKNDEWKQNIEADIAREQKNKEEWAAKQAMGDIPACDDCESCPNLGTKCEEI